MPFAVHLTRCILPILSGNATSCEMMDMMANLASALLRMCEGGVAQFIEAFAGQFI